MNQESRASANKCAPISLDMLAYTTLGYARSIKKLVNHKPPGRWTSFPLFSRRMFRRFWTGSSQVAAPSNAACQIVKSCRRVSDSSAAGDGGGVACHLSLPLLFAFSRSPAPYEFPPGASAGFFVLPDHARHSAAALDLPCNRSLGGSRVHGLTRCRYDIPDIWCDATGCLLARICRPVCCSAVQPSRCIANSCKV